MSENHKQLLPKATKEKHDTAPEKASELISAQSTNKAHKPTSSQQFLQLAKMFSIDGALLPEDKQLVIADRVSRRARNEGITKQNNIENIIKKTVPYCANKDISTKLDYDWLGRYIELAEGISNTTMQDLWAKILAGEILRPGSYSYKTIKLFREMSIFDAKLLAKACSFSVKDLNNKGVRIISGAYQQTSLFNFLNRDREVSLDLSKLGLSYTDILSLSQNQLIYKQESESTSLSKGESLTFNYSGQNLSLVSKKSAVSLQFYKFTPIGTELVQLINSKKDEEYLKALKHSLSAHFQVLSSN